MARNPTPTRNILLEPGKVVKHSVSTDALDTLGSIIEEGEHRDAIHLAVEPVQAGQRLLPGQDVGFIAKGVAGLLGKHVGIVDPFLKKPVEVGEYFWLVVYPRRITSLRHVWTHPDFETADDLPEFDKVRAVSEQWIRTWVDALNDGEEYDVSEYGRITYDEVMAAADEGHGLSKGGILEGKSVAPEFWGHYEIVRGRAPSASQKDDFYFSCSC